jgi:hypothetical protein
MTESDQTPIRATMYCRGCAYILEHLPRNRCPECGLAFDPADSGTFDQALPTRWGALVRWASVWFARGTEEPRRRQIAHAIGYFLVVLALGTVVIVLDHFGVLHAYAAR